MMNNKVSFTNSNNPTISLSAVIYFPPKFDVFLTPYLQTGIVS